VLSGILSYYVLSRCVAEALPLLEQVLEKAHRSGSIGEHALYLAWLSEVRGQELPGKHS
jgi:hypothetical protein